MTSVYICHTPEERMAADYLASELRNRGAEVFVDHQKILPGEHYIGRLGREIERRDAVVLLLSPLSVASKWVRAQVAWALHLRKSIVPVLLDKETSLVEFFFLVDRVKVDFSQWLVDRQVGEAVQEIAMLLSLPLQPLPLVGADQASDFIFDEANLKALASSAAAIMETNSEQAFFIYKCLLEARAEPGVQEVVQRQSDVLKQLRLSNLMAKADAALKAGQWANARQLGQEILKLEPNYADGLRITAISEYNPEYDGIYQQAVKAAKVEQWDAVRHLISSLRQLAPDYGDPQSLLVLRAASVRFMQPVLTLQPADTFPAAVAVAFSSDGKLLASAWADGVIRLWEMPSGREVVSFVTETGNPVSLAFSPRSKLLLSASESEQGAVQIWLLPEATEESRVVDNTICTAVAVSPDKKFMAAGFTHLGITSLLRGAHCVRIWHMPGKPQFASFRVNESSDKRVQFVVFSPDGKLLASDAGDKTVSLWNVYEKQEMDRLIGHTEQVLAGAFSPDGALLATGSADCTVRLWSLPSGGATLPLEGHLAPVNAVAFSPDGTLLVSGSADTTLKVWDTRLYTELVTFEGHMDAVNAVTFSPDGTRIVSAAADGTIQVWGVA